MIYAELPKSSPATYRTIRKKHIAVITPDTILRNEKLMLGLMFTVMTAVLIKWTFKKGK